MVVGVARVERDGSPELALRPGPVEFVVRMQEAKRAVGPFQFFRFNSDGTLAGTQAISRTIALSANGQSFTSTINVQVIGPTGAVVATACCTESATRAQS